MNKFEKAKPIWIEGREAEKNIFCGFKTVIDQFDVDDQKKSIILRITGASLYRVFVNGVFTGFGPARAAHGYYRMDEWNIADNSSQSPLVVAIEVAGYNINSYYLLDQPSFIQAEILVNQEVVKYTSQENSDFICGAIEGKVQKVQRYSFQRTFVECYRLKENFDSWRKNPDIYLKSYKCIESAKREYLDRNITYPTFQKHNSLNIMDCGKVLIVTKETCFKDRSLTDIGPKLKGYKECELEIQLTREAQDIVTISTDKTVRPFCGDNGEKLIPVLDEKAYLTIDFGINKTGFISSKISCKEKTTLYFLFDEILVNNDVDFLRLQCANIIKYELDAGEYSLLAFEPYTMKYLKIVCASGSCVINEIAIIEYTSSIEIIAKFKQEERKSSKIIEAAIETFKQNSVDLFMDCPSRERAGWLCDSFFLGRVEYCLTGQSVIERNFLENYALPDHFEFLPDGMLPMCYPADHYDGNFIPNWALWFVIELEEYFERTKDEILVNQLKGKMDSLLAYFIRFENELELLENLEGWVFVEWSHANDLTQDINFPTNMLYSAALSALGRLYDDQKLIEKSDRIKNAINNLSFDGDFFVDNAVRENGVIRLSGERTEVCQYYAFFFSIANPETHSGLWNIIRKEFGPSRKKSNKYPDIAFANAFIGSYLRLDILSVNGFKEQVMQEIEDYFYNMAETTGTLWEHDSTLASCNHGFASHVLYWIL